MLGNLLLLVYQKDKIPFSFIIYKVSVFVRTVEIIRFHQYSILKKVIWFKFKF
jgi:hypothetical protein